MRFKIIFVEGTFRGGGGYQGEVSCVDVTPALIQVGDNNNIFSELPIDQMDPKSMSMKETFQTRKIEQLDEFTKDCEGPSGGYYESIRTSVEIGSNPCRENDSMIERYVHTGTRACCR